MSQFPNGITRQPKTIDLLQVNKYKLTLHNYPYLEYFCQQVNLPGCNIPEFVQPSYFTAIKRPATTINYEDLTVTFLVTEDLQNWLQIYDWMTRIVPTRSFKEVIQPEKDIYSDITLNILSNKSNRVMDVYYKQCWPKSLTGITFDASTPDAANATATVTFGYAGYTVQHRDDEKQLPTEELVEGRTLLP
jgi:hypothetical protein